MFEISLFKDFRHFCHPIHFFKNEKFSDLAKISHEDYYDTGATKAERFLL